VNYYVQARERWERQQNEMHGCNYVNGRCDVHDRAAIAGKKGLAARITGDAMPAGAQKESLDLSLPLC